MQVNQSWFPWALHTVGLTQSLEAATSQTFFVQETLDTKDPDI